MIIDAKLHEPPVTFKWEGADERTKWDVLLELEIAYMDAVGVDRALLFPVERPWGEYAFSRFPDRFRLVPMVGLYAGKTDGINPLSPDIAKEIARQRDTPGVVGIRLLGGRTNADWVDDYKMMLDACARDGLPVFLTAMADFASVAKVAARYSELPIVFDQMGLCQAPGASPDTLPWKSLPELLALAVRPNVSLLWADPVSLSEQPFPFDDVTPLLRQMVDAFGAQRLMWGSDISRFIGRCGFKTLIPGTDSDYVPNNNYAESLFFILLFLEYLFQINCQKRQKSVEHFLNEL